MANELNPILLLFSLKVYNWEIIFHRHSQTRKDWHCLDVHYVLLLVVCLLNILPQRVSYKILIIYLVRVYGCRILEVFILNSLFKYVFVFLYVRLAEGFLIELLVKAVFLVKNGQAFNVVHFSFEFCMSYF